MLSARILNSHRATRHLGRRVREPAARDGRLIMIIPVSVLLIFVLLFEAFKTVKSAALILLNVPFALIGGILALYLTGIHLSVSAAIGFIALFGQAVLNGVVMVSHFDQLQTAGVAPTAQFMKARRPGFERC